jgi:hypothetical protein
MNSLVARRKLYHLLVSYIKVNMCSETLRRLRLAHLITQG